MLLRKLKERIPDFVANQILKRNDRYHNFFKRLVRSFEEILGLQRLFLLSQLPSGRLPHILEEELGRPRLLLLLGVVTLAAGDAAKHWTSN